MTATATALRPAAPGHAAPAVSGAGARWWRGVVALAAWAAVVVASSIWGFALLHRGVHMQIGAPPLTGDPAWRPNPSLVVVGVLAASIACVLPTLLERLAWRAVLVAAPLGALAWTLAINAVDGRARFTWPVHTEYAATAAGITSPGRFLATFVAHASQYNIHTRGHPPGMPLVLWALRPFGVSSPGTVAAVYVLTGMLCVPAVLVTVAELSGRRAARAAAPFLVLVPGAIWVATSADAFFAGVSAWAVALVVLATGRRDRRGDVLAVGGGVLFGVTAFLSYGLVLLALIPLAVAVSRRRVRPLALAALGAAPVFLGFALAGFSWLDGLRATRAAYWAGVASRRPYGYFLLADLGAFALVVGPAAGVALAWLRDRRLAVLVGAACVVVALADLSGMSKAEVERIWLPFAPWVLAATAAFVGARRRRTVPVLLVLQVATAVGVQLLVRSPW